MLETRLEELLCGFPQYCPRCGHFVEYHLRWVHEPERSEDEFDPMLCRHVLGCRCEWLIEFVAYHENLRP